MRRHHALLSAAAVGVAAIAAGGLLHRVEPDAVTVNGDEITRDEFERARSRPTPANDAYVAQQQPRRAHGRRRGVERGEHRLRRGRAASPACSTSSPARRWTPRPRPSTTTPGPSPRTWSTRPSPRPSSGFERRVHAGARSTTTADVRGPGRQPGRRGRASTGGRAGRSWTREKRPATCRFQRPLRQPHPRRADEAGAEAVLAELEERRGVRDVAVAALHRPARGHQRRRARVLRVEDQTLASTRVPGRCLRRRGRASPARSRPSSAPT